MMRSERHKGNGEARSEAASHLTPRLMLQLAAPHTWPASIMPVLVVFCIATSEHAAVSTTTVFVLLCICILMQSSVNTLNDYFDYIKGADTKENQLDPNDAVLVYHRINPKEALAFCLSLLGVAFLLGLYAVFVAGWIPLAIAAVGALIIYLYSGSRTPISYLPIGELVSGFTMGGLISLACFQVMTLHFSWTILILSLPLMIGIGLIMFTNNTCDIEKDIIAGRRTLGVVLGRPKARRAYHLLAIAWMAAIVSLICLFFPRGWVLIPFMLLCSYPFMKALISNPLISNTRGPAMAQCLSVNVILSLFYAAGILLDGCALF